MIGASGAIAGVLGGYLMLYPRARIATLVMIPFLCAVVPVPAWIFLSGWFLAQFLLPSGSGIAWMAHVGGFLAGLGGRAAARPHPARPAPPRRSNTSRPPAARPGEGDATPCLTATALRAKSRPETNSRIRF